MKQHYYNIHDFTAARNTAIPAAVLCVLLIAGSCAPCRRESYSVSEKHEGIQLAILWAAIESYAERNGHLPETKEALITSCAQPYCGDIDWGMFDIRPTDVDTMEIIHIASGVRLRISQASPNYDIPEEELNKAIKELLEDCPDEAR